MSERDDAGVVVVGAGLGALRVAENLRTNGFDAPITLVGAEPYAPYDRPPLSKGVLLGTQDRPDLKPAAFYDDAAVTLRLTTRVTGIDTGAKELTARVGGAPGGRTASAGATVAIRYGTLVLATGLTPRRFPGTEALAGVHVIRTFDDAAALRAEIEGARTAVVIGAGFIGCEVAASLTGRGLSVALVEPAPTPLAAALGEGIGRLVTRMHERHGVDVRTGVAVAEIVGAGAGAGAGAVRAVRLADGTELPADLVVVGIGSIPVTDYLDGSPIALAARESGGGIACDALGRVRASAATGDGQASAATGDGRASAAGLVPDVFAVGDVANWAGPDGVPSRVEHWNHVVEQASIVAGQIAGRPAVAASVPYFWSDQFEVKIQVLGRPRAEDTLHLVSDDGVKFLAYYSRDGILTGVVGAGKVGAVMKTRAKLATPTPIAELLSS
ncbi:MAG: FAD/NAD(P)-binding oxidoreductase [Gordonia sp. (in: high G+C Gram-positive bacteria)]